MKLDPHNLPRVASLAAELVHEHDSILGESPLWEEREQVLYWVDIDRGQIHRFDPAGRENTTHTLFAHVDLEIAASASLKLWQPPVSGIGLRQ